MKRQKQYILYSLFRWWICKDFEKDPISSKYFGFIGRLNTTAYILNPVCISLKTVCNNNVLGSNSFPVMNESSLRKVEHYNPCIQIKACIKTEKPYKQKVDWT